jgi:hypothetical protein
MSNSRLELRPLEGPQAARPNPTNHASSTNASVTASRLDSALFVAPYVIIDAANSSVATAATLEAARRHIDVTPQAVTIVGTLRPGVVGVDIDPADTTAPAESGIAVGDNLVSWLDRHGLPWCRRASGRPGHLHIIAILPSTLEAEFRHLVHHCVEHHRVAVTARFTLRILSAPHRHHLPAPVLDATMNPKDLSTLPTRKRRGLARATARRTHAQSDGKSRSEGEFGDALARARAGWTVEAAWRAANTRGSKAAEIGIGDWRRYFWAPATTIVAAEQGISEIHAWSRFRRASQHQADRIGLDRWRNERWLPALVEAQHDRPRRYAVDSTPPHHPPRGTGGQADGRTRVSSIRRAMITAATQAAARLPRLPGGIRANTLYAALHALAHAIVHRSGSISVRHWAELARLDVKTIRRARDAAEHLGLIKQVHRCQGGATDCDAWLPAGEAASLITALAEHSPTTQYTPNLPIHGDADPDRLRATHRRERQLWHLLCGYGKRRAPVTLVATSGTSRHRRQTLASPSITNLPLRLETGPASNPSRGRANKDMYPKWHHTANLEHDLIIEDGP